MQDLYFFFEKSECKTRTPFKIGYSLLNRFAVDEDAAFEINAVNFLQTSNAKMAEVWNEEEYEKHSAERLRKHEFDTKMISEGLQRKTDSKNDSRQTHVIYVGHYYNFREGLIIKSCMRSNDFQ